MRSYRFLIVDTYYASFLNSFYLHYQPDAHYEKAKGKLMESCFGTSDFYSFNLRALGHEADEVVMNDLVLQSLWATEHGLHFKSSTNRRGLFKGFVEKMDRVLNLGALYQVVKAQIEKYKPDVLYVQDITCFNPRFLANLKPRPKLIIGQIACPLPPTFFLRGYDLILSSFPHYVSKFTKMGIPSRYFKLAFEKRVLEKLGGREILHDAVFIGSISTKHRSRLELLQKLAEQGTALRVWTEASMQKLLSFHEISGPAWGLDMYNALYHSKIAINQHIDVAETFANNMRLFESTGVGTFLLTDDKSNLPELFHPGIEVETYRTAHELSDKIKYFLHHEAERKQIAQAGQKRTLSEHTYEHRMRELVQIIDETLP